MSESQFSVTSHMGSISRESPPNVSVQLAVSALLTRGGQVGDDWFGGQCGSLPPYVGLTFKELRRVSVLGCPPLRPQRGNHWHLGVHPEHQW